MINIYLSSTPVNAYRNNAIKTDILKLYVTIYSNKYISKKKKEKKSNKQGKKSKGNKINHNKEVN